MKYLNHNINKGYFANNELNYNPRTYKWHIFDPTHCSALDENKSLSWIYAFIRLYWIHFSYTKLMRYFNAFNNPDIKEYNKLSFLNIYLKLS